VVLSCPSRDIVEGWCGAVNAQMARWEAVAAPPRQPPEPAVAAAAAASHAMAPSSGAAVAQRFRALASSAGSMAFSVLSAAAASTAKGAKTLTMKTLATMDKIMEEQAAERAAAALRARPKPAEDYVCFSYWDAAGIDLTSPLTRNVREDEHGHLAAVIHGWLTKRNKSGVRQHVSFLAPSEKDRYFVLTPLSLNYFVDDAQADVRGGYMWGETAGASIGGLFKKTGACLPLESVCEVRTLTREEQARRDAALDDVPHAGGGGAPAHAPAPALPPNSLVVTPAQRTALVAAVERARAGDPGDLISLAAALLGLEKGSRPPRAGAPPPPPPHGGAKQRVLAPPDSDAESGEEAPALPPPVSPGKAPSKPPGPKPPRAEPTVEKPAKEGGGGGGGGGGARSTPPQPPPSSSAAAAAAPTASEEVLLELDFGDFSLLLNAHNVANRNRWAATLKKWSAWRKKTLDEDMFKSMAPDDDAPVT
jgi:hypothetical protein